jgi:hypothetical protein
MFPVNEKDDNRWYLKKTDWIKEAFGDGLQLPIGPVAPTAFFSP